MRAAFVLLALTAVCLPRPGYAQSTVVRTASQSSDDGEETVSTGNMVLTGNVLEHLDNGGVPEYVGMRFPNMTIERGATITNARIQFTVWGLDEIQPDDPITVTYWGEDIDNAPAFTTTAYNISNRTPTTASVDWAIPAWPTINARGAAQLTADLSPIIQEIVDRPGWTPGNALVFLVKPKSGTGARDPASYDNSVNTADPTRAPELTVDYLPPTTSVRVSQASDDAEQRVSNGSMNLTSSDLELLTESAAQYVGIRFQNIQMAQGATITDAWVQFHVDEVEANDPVTITITGEDVDDAVTFTNSNNDIGSRTETTASVDWAVPHWAAVHDEGAAQRTANLAPIIQEILARPGWVPGNDIVILMKSFTGAGIRTAESYNGESGAAPLLFISTLPTPPDPPVITQPASPTTNTLPTISGTASEDGGTITLTSDINGVLTPTATVVGGAWSITLTSPLSVGTHSLTATHTDAQNNVSDPSGAKILVVDDTVVRTLPVQSSDDAEQNVSSGGVNLTSTDLEFLDDGGAQYVGIRFQNITVPPGATISDARIQFHVDEVMADVPITVTFTGEAVDDAATFTTTNNDIGSRPETTASVDWAIPHWVAEHDEGAAQLSTNLSPIIQEIIDRPGWISGNDIVILIKTASGTGKRVAESYNGEAASAPELTIYFQPVAYRSKATGNWSATTTWERKNGASWFPATSYPTSSDSTITVQSGHTVTVDAGVGAVLLVDEMTINSGGTVIVNQKTTVADGFGTDLTIAGQLTINAGKEFNPSAGSRTVVSSGGQITNSGIFNITGSSLVTFSGGSTYTHSQDGGAFPKKVRAVWDTGSTAQVTGVLSAVPTDIDHDFHHFTWNSAGQMGALDLAGAIKGIGGDLTIASTGTGTLSWVQSLDDDLVIDGDFVQTGGTFIYTDGTGVGTMSATDVSVTGGTLDLTTSTGTPTLEIDGALTVSGTGSITETGTGSGTILFSGSSAQLVSAPTGITNDIDLLVNNSGGIKLTANLSAPRHVTADFGIIDLDSFDLAVGGDLIVNSDLANPATFTFNGTGTQNLTYAPGTLSLPILTIDKTAGTFLLGTDLTITTTASVCQGTLDVNGRTLTFNHGTTLFNDGTVTGNVVFKRTYSQNSDGWRMLATPVDGINYSSLNTSFHTQGAPWADFSDGSATLQAPDFAAQWWTPINGADAGFAAAQGYIFYMFKTLFYQSILPATWTVTGPVRANTPKALSWNTVSTDSYNFVGNRTTSKIDWDAAVTASTNVATTYATWDPALTTGGGMTGYKYYNSASGIGLAGRYIPPFTAFMVEPTASGGSLVFATSKAANLEAASYFGKRETVSSHIRLMIEGEGSAELETYLTFDDEAVDGDDNFDANRLRPLSTDFVTLVSLEGDRQLAFDGRSMADGEQQFTLGVAATREGTYRMSWPDWHMVPDGWAVSLFDRDEGRTTDLRAEDAYEFVVRDVEPLRSGYAASFDAAPRFTVTIADTLGDAVTAGMPAEVVLAQNYPNPFNPTTTIRYAVPETAPVVLEVFDVIGRRVARLVDRTEDPGWKTLQWDASRLASGLYFSRLSVGSKVLSRPMMLLR